LKIFILKKPEICLRADKTVSEPENRVDAKQCLLQGLCNKYPIKSKEKVAGKKKK